MRRTLSITALLLAIVCGCQNGPESEMKGLTSRRSSAITVTGRLASNESRTSLASDGGTVLWSEGDNIGVFTDLVKNVNLTLESSCAGSTEGVFKGSATGTPKYAYFPYDADAAVTASTVSLFLPDTQIQRGGAPDMSLDVKVGSLASDDRNAGFVFDFTQKMVLLHFTLTPDASLEGDRLRSISLAVAGRSLAGAYTLSLADPSAALAFAQGASSKLSLKFDGEPQLGAGTTVEGWMFVNADVASGDKLDVRVNTDRHCVKIDLTSSKTFQMGYRYGMPLEIAALVADGRAVVGEPSGDISGLTELGVYDCGTASYLCKYEEGVNQYAVATLSDSYEFRVQNYAQGYSVAMQWPSTAAAGSNVQLTVVSYGKDEIAAGTFTVKVVKVEGQKLWLLDEANSMGYIVTKE
ncbi:MAG: fimbrillin family protein [Bacteroidales bacterium]|nr:fimbrillin family protein [Bacteroidales bacterium]